MTSRESREGLSNGQSAHDRERGAAATQLSAHFWVISSPFCDTTLFLVPQPGIESGPAVLKLHDADGALVNEAQIGCEGGRPVALELEPFMEGCKLESGFRHGHLQLEYPSQIRPLCRLHNRAGAVMSSASLPVLAEQARFVPVTLSPERMSLLTLINVGPEVAPVRVRLLIANRSPDVTIEVPAFGARVVPLEREFRSALNDPFQGQTRRDPAPESDQFPEARVYVRVSVRGEHAVAMQLVESREDGEAGTRFTAMAR